MSVSENLSSPVQRLVDMLVEEVSLVDRAANKHRFLIVKRNIPMNESNETKAQVPEENSATETSDSATEVSEEHDVILSQALSALEQLTELVRSMSMKDVPPSKETIASISSKLQSLLEGQQVESPSSSDAKEVLRATKDTGEETGQKIESPKSFGDVSQMFQHMLGELQSSLQAALAPLSLAGSPAHPGSVSQTHKSEVPREASRAVSPELKPLMEHMMAMASAVQSQQGRIHQMEKFVGLPNSAQEERTSSQEATASSSWPMDMNRPLDRETVDKSISFHGAGE